MLESEIVKHQKLTTTKPRKPKATTRKRKSSKPLTPPVYIHDDWGALLPIVNGNYISVGDSPQYVVAGLEGAKWLTQELWEWIQANCEKHKPCPKLSKERIAELSTAFAPDPPKPLTQADVDQYAYAKLSIDEAEATVKRLRPQVLHAFQNGGNVPDNGVCVLRYAEPRHCIHSPEAIIDLLLARFGDPQAASYVEQLRNEKAPRPEISVKTNPKFLRDTIVKGSK